MKLFEIIMKRTSLVLIAVTTLLFGAEALAGETSSLENKAPEWRSPFFSPKVGNLYFLGGAGFYDTDSLNDALGDNGYSKLKNSTLSLGMGGDISIGRLITGLEGQWLKNVGTQIRRDDMSADIDNKYWLFRIGVDLVHWRGLRVYPLFGIGSGQTRITVSSEDGAAFDEVLADPGREVRLKQTSLLLDASLGVDYRFKVRETERRSTFFTVGVRGGYLFAPYSGEWKTGGGEITGGPDALIGGPTVQLLIGFSGERKKACHYQCAPSEK